VWGELCGGLVLVMAMYSARNIPPCSGVRSVEDMWCGFAALAAVCLLECCAGLGMCLSGVSTIVQAGLGLVWCKRKGGEKSLNKPSKT
jgi:hypothetical protein